MSTRPAPGYFIALEGPEGSGKSLQARALADRLRAAGRTVVFTREPGGTALGSHVRELVLLRDELHITARTEALLMCTSRAQLVDEVLRPGLERGDVLVCDRYADSTLAYQGYGRGLDLSALRQVLTFATGGLKPDLTLLLDVPVETGLARKAEQVGAASTHWNRFEAETTAFHQRVRDGYHALVAAEPERWRVLDGTRSVTEIEDEIWNLVESAIRR